MSITITSANDNDPDVADVTVTHAENIAAGTSIKDLSDTSGGDTDADGSALTYAITGGNDSGLFALDTATGVITLATNKALDYDTSGGQSHTLTISATAADGGSADTATVTINVTNVNDNDPDVADVTVTHAENIAAGTSITNLSDTSGGDTDADGSALTYAITAGNDSGLFALDTATGEITLATNKALDYDTSGGKSHTLTISATAADGGSADTATVTINVTGVNDNNPDVADVTVTHAENIAAGTSITDLSDTSGGDTDADGSALTYAITAGNDSGLFALDTATGEITLATNKALDYDTSGGQSHTLTISATAADGGSADTATVTVNVTGVNDNNPDVADVTVTHAENIAAGTSITDLSDTSGGDTDADGSALTYAITGGNDSGLFALDTATGEITLATNKALDYDTSGGKSHTLTISATAADGGSADTATVTVNVTGVNDNSPDVADVTVTHAENIAAGTSITDLSDTSGGDTDADGSALTYAITGGNDSGLFALDTATGVITLATNKALDYDTSGGKSHTLTISATAADGGSADTATVTINITNINDNDPDVADVTVTHAENIAAGTSITDLSDTSGGDTDADGSALTYAITGGNDSGLFALDTATGEITLATNKALDYDTSGGKSHTLTISATAADGGSADTATVTVTVTGVNDNNPDVADVTVTHAENIAAGTSITDLSDTSGGDTDADGSALTYAITGGNDSGLFALDTATGEITLATNKALDYDIEKSHKLTISATAADGGSADTATVTIKVGNTDLNAPDIADVSISHPESISTSTEIIDLNDQRTNLDQDNDGDAITYTFTNDGNPGNLFSIDPSTGTITLGDGQSLDYENPDQRVIQLIVQATDGSKTDQAAVTVNVTGVNDNNPDVADVTVTHAENIAAGTSITDLSDTSGGDTDADGSALTYAITGGNDSGLFALDTATGVITLATNKALDYDTSGGKSHTLTISATAADGGSADTATVTINITNINDNDPDVADVTVTHAENIAAGTSITDLSDTSGGDTDADGSTLTYAITGGNDSGLFALDTATGEITLATNKALDYDTSGGKSHTLTISATAADGGSADTATVTVTVTGVNDNNPDVADVTVTHAENIAAGTSITDLSDTSGGDTDADGSALTYAITGGNDSGLFALDTATGEITLATNKALDYDTSGGKSHTLTISATAADGGSADTATVTINVTGVNDNDPSITAQSLDILESISAGTELIDLSDSNTSNDTDLDGEAITYSITKGNENKLFAIEKATGKLSLATGESLDYDDSDQHVLTIKATDTGGRTGTATITINVQDANTAPDAVDDAITLNEDSSVDVTAASGIIQSNDSDAEGDFLTVHKFYLGDSAEANPTEGILGQAINSTYGLLTLNADGSYQYSADNADALGSSETVIDSFHYTLSDGKLTQTADIQFTISGINDAPSLVDATKKKKYTEGQSNVTVIDGSLDVVDPDDTAIESATIKFSSDTYQASEDVLGFTDAFNIVGDWDSATGELSLTGSTTISNYIAALETVTYTNTDNKNPVLGHRKIEWTVNDGESNSTAITSIVDVGGTNDAPESVDEAVAVEASSTVSTESQAKLLANDTDPEGDSLTIQQFRLGTEQQSSTEFQAGNTLTGQFGKMTIEADGSYTYVADQTASKRLLTGETRTETFTYTVSDSKDTDTGEITFTITGINDSPVAINDAFEVQEDSSKFRPTVQGLISNDSDIDGDSLSISTVRAGAETSTFDISSNTLSRTAVGTYGTIVINEDGSYRYTADQDAADALDPGDEVTDLFTYTISDGETTDTAEIAIKVTGVNDQPTLNAIPAGTISDQENSTDLVTSNLTGTLTASDPDASASLSFGISSVSSSELRSQSNDIGLSATSTQAGTYGTLSLNTSTGAYNYTPNSAAIEALSAGDSVSDSFTLYASDGSLSASQSFQINITGATDPSSSSDSGSGSTSSSSSSSSTTSDQDDTALLSSKRETNSFSTLSSDGQLQERYRSMPAAKKRDTGLGQDLNQFGLTSRNSDMELGTSGDGIGTALNIFGVTLLALLDPAEAIRAFLENLKGSGSQELCEQADSWAGSEFCSQIDFEQQQAPALPPPTDVQGMAPQAQANPMANPAALGLEPLQSQADPWWPDQTAQGF